MRPRPRALTLVTRALRLRCPNCGGGPLFSRWFRMRERCPRCDIHLERNESGYVVGAYMFNIAVGELFGVAVLLGIAVATWPNPPWDVLLYGGMALMVATPILFYPFAKTLFLAFDLAFRPAGDE
ncbi:MAG: DUF983 domain-containing protein [Gemmatimonadales bacterium]